MIQKKISLFVLENSYTKATSRAIKSDILIIS
jgi:hypothetical protein